ncbi:MAG: copper resistance protein CopZ [Alphaproteobacteria bacterium]|nr:copper resistance protein CopZ [Alphaproteobacteria bacterium]
MSVLRLVGCAAFCVLVLAGCKDQLVMPDPVKLTREAIGNYCNMIIADHPGPKVQIHEKGYPNPLWFSSVRDGLAYLSLPGEAQKVLAIYVHDMGLAASWAEPQDEGIWIDAQKALYVIGSAKRGGMGAKETVPFKDRTKAQQFVARHGGQIVDLKGIPSTYLIGDDGEHPVPTVPIKEHDSHGS